LLNQIERSIVLTETHVDDRGMPRGDVLGSREQREPAESSSRLRLSARYGVDVAPQRLLLQAASSARFVQG
jgi:hypothetical protein